MKDQLELLPYDGAPFATTPSRALMTVAARAVRARQEQQERARALYVAAGDRGLTDFELADKLGITRKFAASVRTSLQAERSWGDTRWDKFGVECQVWILADGS